MKSVLDNTNLFFSNEYEKNDKTLKHKIFSLTKRLRWRNYIALFAVSIENLKILKCHSSSGKTIICCKYENADGKV